MRVSDEFQIELNGNIYEVQCIVNCYFDVEFQRDWKEVEFIKVFDEFENEIENDDIIDEISESCLDREYELHCTDFDYYDEVDHIFGSGT